MVENLIHYVFTRTARTWRIDGKDTKPSEADIAQALDKAAALLIDSPPDTILEVGGLIIQKAHLGHEVYVHVGSYL